jgi:hypothetical protein
MGTKNMTVPVELLKDETVTTILWRHPVYVALKLTGAAIVLLVSVYVLFVLDPNAGLIGSLLELAFAVLGVGAILALFLFWYRYQNDVWIITDQRLIDSVRQHPFQHQVSTAHLRNVQEITIDVNGLLPTLVGFGDVRCWTAGTESSFVFSGVPEPKKVMDTINNNIEKRLRG